MQDTYSISELGREFGITTRAIRFYEDKQLLSPGRNGQRRVYSRADRTRLKLLLRGKRLGWPLEEIRTILNMYDASEDGEFQQLEYTCQKVSQRREHLEQQRKDIEAALTDLDHIRARCETHMASLQTGQKLKSMAN